MKTTWRGYIYLYINVPLMAWLLSKKSIVNYCLGKRIWRKNAFFLGRALEIYCLNCRTYTFSMWRNRHVRRNHFLIKIITSIFTFYVLFTMRVSGPALRKHPLTCSHIHIYTSIVQNIHKHSSKVGIQLQDTIKKTKHWSTDSFALIFLKSEPTYRSLIMVVTPNLSSGSSAQYP